MDNKIIKRLRIGGSQDTAALLSVASGLMASNPFFTEGLISLAGGDLSSLGSLVGSGSCLALSGIGGAYGAKRIKDSLEFKGAFPSELSLRSSPLPNDWDANHQGRGLLLGYTVDTGAPLVLPYSELVRHLMVCGMTGVGKTVLGTLMMFQQIRNGGGVLLIDGKLDQKNISELRAMSALAGREADFLVINPEDPDNSNTYNPILFGDPDEVAARVIQLVPSTESNAGADHYKQSGNQGLTTIVSALQATGLAYSFIDLTILLMSPKALQYLENRIPEGDVKTNYSLFLDQYRLGSKDGAIDMKRLKETFGGLGGRLFQFGTNKIGRITNTYTPEVNLYEAIRSNKIIYVALNTMGKSTLANNFGKMVLSDLRTAISWLQKLPEADRPSPPFMMFADEFGSYATDAMKAPFEQARSASMFLVPAFQTKASLDAPSPEFTEVVSGNSATKVFFKIGTQETAEFFAELIGMEPKVTDSISAGGGHGDSSSSTSTSPNGSQSSSSNLSFSERQDEDYKVSPDQLKALGKGEAIVVYEGSKVYHIRIPMITPTRESMEAIGPFRINHPRQRPVAGIDLFKRADQFLSTGGKARD